MIQLVNVSKWYTIENRKRIIMREVNAVFQTGHSYGLLGVNGAGKSTTLRLIAGSELPNRGKVRRSVRVSWPLGFAGSFHGDMTGIDNLHFVARIYGEDALKVSRFVQDFAEIGDYIKAPVKTYSSGMMARLAFGLSMAIEFDCYLIDEITAVGDARFQQRCRDAFAQRREGADVIMVSHSMQTIQEYCDKAAVLVDGQLMMYDSVDKAVETYNRLNR